MINNGFKENIDFLSGKAAGQKIGRGGHN